MVSGVSDDDKPAWRKQLETSLDELKTLGAQVSEKVGEKAKDAQHEAREAWTKLEPRIGEAEVKLREATDSAVEQLEGMFSDLRQSLSGLKDKL